MDKCVWPKITIVTASYNQGQFLEHAIRSIIHQDYPNLEYFVMDGGSSDNSIEIIKKYQDKITYWQSQKDKGQADAIAQGFARATGEILGWINSDDFLLPGALRAIGKAFQEEPDRVWVAGRCAIVDTQGNPYSIMIPTPQSLGHLLFWGASFAQQATFWKREAYEKAGGLKTEMHFAFDFDLFVNLCEQSKINIIKDYIAGFRFHPDSKTCSWGIDVKFNEGRQIIQSHKRVGRWYLAFRKWIFIHSPPPFARLRSKFYWAIDKNFVKAHCKKSIFDWD